MDKYSRKINFSAGPCTLPVEVLEKIRDGLLNYENNGLGVMEMSHRSEAYTKIHDGLIALIKEIMNLNDDYEVLLLQGGASTQFDMIPMNFLNGKKGAYVISGVFSNKAYQTAKAIYGDNVYIATDSTSNNFTSVEDPSKWKIEKDTAYLHFTTNNTVYGLTIRDRLPKFDFPVIADMSSNIFSERFDYTQFDMIYAGAQKNMGCAGLTLAVIKKSFLATIKDNVPTMFNYLTHVKGKSAYNTPPTFPIYVAYENLKWFKEKGGAKQFEINNNAKAAALYDLIDNSSFYVNKTEKKFRSIMNVTFFTPNADLDKKFVEEAKKYNIISIKGYSKAGGLRASMYNGMSLDEVKILVDFMKKFENENK